MATLGRSPGAAPLTSADIPDNSITSAKIVAGTVAASDVAADVATQAEIDLKAPLTNAALVTPNLGTPSAGVMTNMTGAVEASLVDNAVTLAKMAGGTDGNLITYDTSGNPAYVATGASGEVLTSAGADAVPAFAAAAGGGGLDCFQQFRLTVGKNGVTSEVTIDSNITEQSGGISSYVTQSSGIFSFTTTGVYWIFFNTNISYNNETRNAIGWINAIPAGGGSYAHEATFIVHRFDPGGADVFSTGSCNYLFDVSNTTNCKIKFTVEAAASSNFLGDGSHNRTYFTFLRIGDT